MSRNCLLLLCLTNGVVVVCSASIVFAGELPRARIVYATLRPANWELYLFEPNAAPKQITDPALDYDATFSPDGNPQPYGELFVASFDGKPEPVRLTHNKWEDSNPCWRTLEESRK